VARREALQQLQKVEDPSDMPEDIMRPGDLPGATEEATSERLLAEIDQDGFAFAVNAVDETFFNKRERRLPRRRYKVDVVGRASRVCLRKTFSRLPFSEGLRPWFLSRLGLAFYSEVAALLRLRDSCGVPRLRGIDLRRRIVYTDFIKGDTLRDRLATGKEPVHDLDLSSHPELSVLSSEQREERETILFRPHNNDDLKRQLRSLVTDFNHRGVAIQDIKYGNAIVGAQSHKLYWVDFERAYLEPSLGWPMAVDQQNRLLNDRFDLNLTVSRDIREQARVNAVYSPVDFGPLGTLGDVTNVEIGEGRWRWLLRDLAPWPGKRILDLGSNNGLYAVRALIAGAAEVTCVERDSRFFQQAQFVKRVTEQTAGSLNAQLVNADILSYLRGLSVPEGHFDITMALCSIYYLSREAIKESMRIIARVSNECWLQANTGTERESDELKEKASPAFLAGQLRDAGFSVVTEIAPKRYSRPLLLGRKPSSS
jgi:hypothetical protein